MRDQQSKARRTLISGLVGGGVWGLAFANSLRGLEGKIGWILEQDCGLQEYRLVRRDIFVDVFPPFFKEQQALSRPMSGNSVVINI